MVAHPVKLRGLTFQPDSGAPLVSNGGALVLIERQDDEFVKAVLGELGSADGRKLLAKTVISAAPSVSGGLKLLQPVHGVFNLALMEAHCDIFGEPRLDSSSIDSAGLVIRRVDGSARQAWVKRDGKIAGWVTLHGDELDRDPDPARRDGPSGPGPAEVRRELLRLLGASSRDEESVMPMFAAPPAACAALGRTLLYGMVTTASAEAPEGSGGTSSGYDASEVQSLLSPYFASGKPPDWKGLELQSFSFADLKNPAFSADVLKKLSLFTDFLRGLVAVFDAFSTPKLLEALNRVSLDYGDSSSHKAGDVLSQAANVLVLGKPGAVKLPKVWPTVSAKDQGEIIAQARTAASARIAQLISNERRFDRRKSTYVARAFVRVKTDDGCPPHIVWSPESAPFTIAAWHEKGKLPPMQVSLPSLGDLKSYTPNVVFKVPTNLFALLKNDPKDFLEGKAQQPPGDGIAWLCGFNIPIITLVAFIVLNIFLSLLNIVFFWIAFIKICIPIPASLKARFEE